MLKSIFDRPTNSDYIRQIQHISWSDCIRHIPNIFGSEIEVKSIFARPTKCACTMPIVVPEEIFLLALHPPLARRSVRSRRQLLCPTRCAFPHCSSTRPAKRAHHHHHHHRIWNRTCAGCQIRPGSHFGSNLTGLIASLMPVYANRFPKCVEHRFAVVFDNTRTLQLRSYLWFPASCGKSFHAA